MLELVGGERRQPVDQLRGELPEPTAGDHAHLHPLHEFGEQPGHLGVDRRLRWSQGVVEVERDQSQIVRECPDEILPIGLDAHVLS